MILYYNNLTIITNLLENKFFNARICSCYRVILQIFQIIELSFKSSDLIQPKFIYFHFYPIRRLYCSDPL